MQGIFRDYLKETDPIEDSFRYQKKLEQERRMMEMQRSVGNDIFTNRGNDYIDPEEQEALWQSTQKTIMDGYMHDDEDDSHRQFNVSDWI